RVIVQGRLKIRQFERQDGSRGQSTEIDVDEVGPSMRNATAKVTKVSRSGGGFSGGGGNQAPANDPWTQPAPGQSGSGQSGSGGGDPWATSPGGSMDEPPF